LRNPTKTLPIESVFSLLTTCIFCTFSLFQTFILNYLVLKLYFNFYRIVINFCRPILLSTRNVLFVPIWKRVIFVLYHLFITLFVLLHFPFTLLAQYRFSPSTSKFSQFWKMRTRAKNNFRDLLTVLLIKSYYVGLGNLAWRTLDFPQRNVPTNFHCRAMASKKKSHFSFNLWRRRPIPVNFEVSEADIESENIGVESSKLEGELEEAGKGKKGIRKIKIALGLRKKPATEANTVF